MRKILLFLSLFLCTLVAVAQTDFKIDVKKQRTDDMMEFTFHYNGVNKNTTFEVFKYENEAVPEKPSIKFSTLERLPDGVEAENFYKMEDGNFVLDPNTKQLICIYEFTGDESYSCYLDGLDLTGSTAYQIAIKATITDGNDKIKEETVFIREANGQFTGNATPIAEEDQDDATRYTFTYGLPDIPVLSDGKSTSVKLSWTSDCLFPEPGTKPDFYTIYGYKTENGETTYLNIATTTETEYLITRLVPSVDYQFFVRAYKDGAYLSTSPNSNVYTPVRTECLTFTNVTSTKNTITLTILEFSDGFNDNKDFYELSNGAEPVKCSTIDTGKGILTFKFNNAVDYTKEFRLETKIKKQDEGEVKAVGVFKLDNEGKLSTQHCDIEIGLKVTKTTQYVAELAWSNPGFDVKTAILEVINLDNSNSSKTITLENPSVTEYFVGNLEHSTNYKFVLTLEDDGGYNTTKDEVITKTKVGSICGLEGVTSASALGCGGNGFLAPYDVEFYTEYENDKPKVTVRFKLNSTDEINSVKLYYAPDGDFFTTLLNIKELPMSIMSDGWYSASFDKLSGVNNMDGRRFYFSVAVTPAKRCGYWPLNFYLTKSVAYQIGTGCQDEEVYKIIEFEKTYDAQSQFTLQTTGSMASVGVFPESGYNKGEFDLKQRLYYNNFNDAPSKFTLDISKYAVGKYYIHIHDVYGEADKLKYLWAIY